MPPKYRRLLGNPTSSFWNFYFKRQLQKLKNWVLEIKALLRELTASVEGEIDPSDSKIKSIIGSLFIWRRVWGILIN